jgi:hypothetical protein
MKDKYCLTLQNHEEQTLMVPQVVGRIFGKGEEIFLDGIYHLAESALNGDYAVTLNDKPLVEKNSFQKLTQPEIKNLKNFIDSSFSNRKYLVASVESKMNLTASTGLTGDGYLHSLDHSIEVLLKEK